MMPVPRVSVRNCESEADEAASRNPKLEADRVREPWLTILVIVGASRAESAMTTP